MLWLNGRDKAWDEEFSPVKIRVINAAMLLKLIDTDDLLRLRALFSRIPIDKIPKPKDEQWQKTQIEEILELVDEIIKNISNTKLVRELVLLIYSATMRPC